MFFKDKTILEAKETTIEECIRKYECKNICSIVHNNKIYNIKERTPSENR